MYTEDDKYTKHKRKSDEFRSTISNNYNNITYDEDFYKDFEDDIYDNYLIDSSLDDDRGKKKKKQKHNINKLDTSYTDDYSDNTYYNYDKKSLDKKKYTVIIIILVIFLIALVCILLRSINVKPPSGNNTNYVRLNYDQLDMKIGETKKIDLILSDTNSNYKVKWFSSDDNIVTVDNSGKIFAIKEGNAVIMVAYYLNNKTYDAQCHVTISK